jgi:hypothetical protein
MRNRGDRSRAEAQRALRCSGSDAGAGGFRRPCLDTGIAGPSTLNSYATGLADITGHNRGWMERVEAVLFGGGASGAAGRQIRHSWFRVRSTRARTLARGTSRVAPKSLSLTAAALAVAAAGS